MKYLQMLALHKRFREAEHDEEVKKDPVLALSKYQEVVRDAVDEEIGARALYRVARIRLKLGDTRDAADLAEGFIRRNRALVNCLAPVLQRPALAVFSSKCLIGLRDVHDFHSKRIEFELLLKLGGDIAQKHKLR